LKWEPYGLSFRKNVIYRRFRARPVIFLDPGDDVNLVKNKGLVKELGWRVVTFDYGDDAMPVDWTHEREWRAPIDVEFSKLPREERPVAVVKQPDEKESYWPCIRPMTMDHFTW